MEQWRAAGVDDYGLPELFPGEYMLSFLLDIGPTRSNGLSECPTDWDIILPYATAKGLDDDDMALLADMCRAYLIARNEGINPLSIAPVDRT